MTEGTAPHATRVGRNYESNVPMYRYYIKKCQHTAYYRQRMEPDSTGYCQSHEVTQEFTNCKAEVVEILPRPVSASENVLAVLNPAEKEYRRGRVINDATLALQYDKALLKNRVKDELVYRQVWTYDDAAEVATYLQAQSDLRMARLAARRPHRAKAVRPRNGVTTDMVEEVMSHLDADVYKGHDGDHHEEEAAA